MCYVLVSTLHSGSYRKTSPCCSKPESLLPSAVNNAERTGPAPPQPRASRHRMTVAPGRALHSHGRADDSSLSCTVPLTHRCLCYACTSLREEPELPFLSAKPNRTGLKVATLSRARDAVLPGSRVSLPDR